MALKENVGAVAILLGIVYTCTLATANCGPQEKPISVVLKGKVVCDACSLDEIVSGAVVAVECSRGLNRKMSAGLVSIEGETNENGEFKLELPSSIISSVLLSSSSSDDHNPTLKGYCSVRLLSSPQEKCNVPFPITSSSDLLTLTSDCHGIRTFTFPSSSCCPQSKLCSHRDITGLSDHESLPTGRVLHEVRKGSSNGMDASLPHANFLPPPKPQLGFPHLPPSASTSSSPSTSTSTSSSSSSSSSPSRFPTSSSSSSSSSTPVELSTSPQKHPISCSHPFP